MLLVREYVHAYIVCKDDGSNLLAGQEAQPLESALASELAL